MPKARKSRMYISIDQGDGTYRRGDYLQLYPEKSLWQTVVDFINSLPKDKEFSRKELHYAVGNASTVDSYRNLLCKTPYVETTKRPGRYIKKQNIPDKATLTKLKKFSSCKDYKKWFVPFEDWIK